MGAEGKRPKTARFRSVYRAGHGTLRTDAESALGPNQFAVEKLLAHRRVSSGSTRTKLEYLVRWVGYGPEDDSWEPSRNVEGSLKQDYLANN